MTPRQEAFVREYLVDLNATQAYIRAGYAARGNAATVSASQLLANPKVAVAVAEARVDRGERTKIDADWVLRRLAEEAEADIADLYDDDGNLLPIRQWPIVWRKGLIAGIETIPEKVGTDADGNPIYRNGMRIKLADRGRVKELLGKHVYVSAFREKIDHTSSDGSMSPPSLADFYAAMGEPRE